MAFLTTTSILTDQFVGALCNTLVHSLWQGALLAITTGVLIISTRKSSSALRYNLLIAVLVVFAIGVATTFTIQLDRVKPVVATIAVPTTVISSFTTVIVNKTPDPIVASTFNSKLHAYLNNNHNTIVLIWFLIICAKSIQLGFGLWGVRHLKTKQVAPVDTFWNDSIALLASNLAVKQTISLLESGLTKVPMVIGNLKPVILMPIGLLTALSTAEVEAILVHELAHIKRRDYLVNLLQSLMEIVFFFNPAVLWVSQLIKTERENCCDDLALQQSSDKASYVRALLSCEEYQQAVPAYAIAFPGGKSSLFDRVKRIAGNRNHTLNLFEKTALAICLVASGLFFSAFSEKEKIRDMADKIATVIYNIQTKSEHEKPKETVTVKKENKVVNKKAAADNLDLFNPNNTKDSTITTVATSNTINNLSFNTGAHLNLFSACLPPLGVQLAALNAKTDVKLNSTMSLKSSIKINSAAADSSSHTYNYQYDAANKMWYDHQPNRKPYSDTTKKYANFDPSGNKARQSAFVNEMLKDGLVKTRDNLSYKINEDTFIINGIQQPEDIRKKYFGMTVNPNVDYKYKNGDVRKAVDSKVNVNTNVKTNVNTTVNTNVNLHLDTLRNSSSMSFQNKNGERSTYKNNNTMLYKPTHVTYNATLPKKPDSANKNSIYKKYPMESLHKINITDSGRRLSLNPRLSLKLNIPSMADALYNEGLIKDKTHFTAQITNHALIVNGVKQSEENHQKILKLYQKKPDDKVNLSFTYPGN